MEEGLIRWVGALLAERFFGWGTYQERERAALGRPPSSPPPSPSRPREASVASCDLALALSADLVEGRVGNLVGVNLGRSLDHVRSEERRVGKECRSRGAPAHST